MILLNYMSNKNIVVFTPRDEHSHYRKSVAYE